VLQSFAPFIFQSGVVLLKIESSQFKIETTFQSQPVLDRQWDSRPRGCTICITDSQVHENLKNVGSTSQSRAQPHYIATVESKGRTGSRQRIGLQRLEFSKGRPARNSLITESVIMIIRRQSERLGREIQNRGRIWIL
jgi:hypothetical protein